VGWCRRCPPRFRLTNDNQVTECSCVINPTGLHAPVETAIGRYKQVIGDGLRFRKDGRRATEVRVAVHALNRMLEFGRPISVRIK
jgi:hypothetical protein